MDIVYKRRVSITVAIFLFLYYKCEEQKGSVGGGKHVEGGGAEDLEKGAKLVEGGAEDLGKARPRENSAAAPTTT